MNIAWKVDEGEGRRKEEGKKMDVMDTKGHGTNVVPEVTKRKEKSNEKNEMKKKMMRRVVEYHTTASFYLVVWCRILKKEDQYLS